MLLATNQEWQDRVRAEAIEVCQGQPPDIIAVNKMKVVCLLFTEFRTSGFDFFKELQLKYLLTCS